MIEFKEDLKKHAKSIGVDLIGFSSEKRYKDAKTGENPFEIFPEGKTVILLGKRITRGTLRGIEEGTNFADYSFFGSSWLDDNANSLMCYELTRYLEDRGYEAVPIYPNPTESKGMGVSVDEEKTAPNVAPDFAYAVVASGLGEIGYCGEILTPEFGPRQRWQMIITDAEIEEDPILEDSICTHCEKCAKVCPLSAITSSRIIEICGKQMKTGVIDYNLCKKCKNGAYPNRLMNGAKPDRIAALCVRTCVNELERNRNIKNTFEKPFRKRSPWAIDIFDKSIDIKEE